MDTGVRDLEVAFLRLILPDLMTYVAKIYQIRLYMLRYDSSTYISLFSFKGKQRGVKPPHGSRAALK